MTIITLDPAPTFRGKVSIPVVGAEPAVVGFVFKHRTRKAFDELMRSGKVENFDDLPVDERLRLDHVFIMGIVEGWDLPFEFNAENVMKLLNGYHAAANAISTTYADLLLSGRLGN